MKSQSSSKMGHVGLITRSNLRKKKLYARSRGHIYVPILMKCDRNVCIDKILEEFENGSCPVKTLSQGQILGKPSVLSRGCIFGPILMKLGWKVCLEKISDNE